MLPARRGRAKGREEEREREGGNGGKGNVLLGQDQGAGVALCWQLELATSVPRKHNGSHHQHILSGFAVLIDVLIDSGLGFCPCLQIMKQVIRSPWKLKRRRRSP